MSIRSNGRHKKMSSRLLSFFPRPAMGQVFITSLAVGIIYTDRASAADDASIVAQAAAPVFDAIREAMAENALNLEPQPSLSERLIALGRLDGAGRDIMEKTDLSKFLPRQRQAISDVSWAEIRLHDRQNQVELMAMVPKAGWFDQTVVGKEAAKSAFLVVQHAVNNKGFMEDALQRMKRDVGTDKIYGPDYAELLDRVEMQDKRPQTYGTQFVCKNNQWKIYNIKSLSEAESLRKMAGFKSTVAEDIKYFANMPPCVVPHD